MRDTVYSGVETVSVYDESQTWKRDFVLDVTRIDRILMLEHKDVLDQDGDSNTTELTRSYYHSNALGSVMEISTASQTEAVSYRYSPFGLPAATRAGNSIALDPLSQDRTFQARSYDVESGLLMFRSRHQDPASGRWLQRDSLGYADGANLYQFVGSSPVNFRDPFGTFKGSDHAAITKKALEELGFGKDCIDKIVEANKGTDKILANPNNGSDHFTSPPALDVLMKELEEKVKAVEDANGDMDDTRANPKGCAYYKRYWSFVGEMVVLEANVPCEDILEKIGKMLHNLQDFFAHTNYVQFFDQGKAPPWTPGKALPIGVAKRGGMNGDRPGTPFRPVFFMFPLDIFGGDHQTSGFDSGSETDGAAKTAAEATKNMIKGLTSGKLDRCCPRSGSSPAPGG